MHRTIAIAIAIAIALLLPIGAQAQRVDLEDVELVVNAGQPVEVLINGLPAQILIEPDAVSSPAVNPDAAERLELEPSMTRAGFYIGDTMLDFSTDRVRYEMAGERFRLRTVFGEMRVAEGADGVTGPETFPQRRVVLQMRPETPDDRDLVFPLDRMGRSQTGVLIEVGGIPIHAAFSFARRESLVSATGGRVIADELGGYFSGETRNIPILYGVSRPIRPLTLAEPLMLGELEIRNLAVRTTDHGNSRGIDESPTASNDSNEIVVTADSGREAPPQRIFLGLDTIGHCASITYDFEAEMVTLKCPPQAGSSTTEAS